MSRQDPETPREDRRAAGAKASAARRAQAAEVRKQAAEEAKAAREQAGQTRRAAVAYARELREERMAQALQARATRHGRQGREEQPPEAPIWTRPEPGARRARLSREDIAAEALAIADAEGIDAVSMRRVAAALDVGTMSLYHYVRTKAELIDLMSDAMMAEVLVPAGELPPHWRPALQAIATRSVEAFRAHPWAIEAPPSAPGPNALRHFEQSLEALTGLDVDVRTRFEIIAMVDDYAFGFALREAQDQRERAAESDGTLDAVAAYVDTQLATGKFPQLESLGAIAATTREALETVARLMHDEGRFVRGLARLLDGIALDLERRGIATG